MLPTVPLSTGATNPGLLLRSDLLAAGVKPSTIDHRLARGQLIALQRGAYQPAGIELGAREQLLAATHRAGGWATGWSALALYGVVDFDPELACWVAVDKQRRVRGVDFIVRRQVLAQSDLRTVRHVPCVGPFLAVCDYARRVQGMRLLDAIDELRRAG